ncbi:MAG: GyrI-like domain-containing protein [Coprobacillus sp.]
MIRCYGSDFQKVKYSIKELGAFSVIGQEVELTRSQKENIQISTKFWQTFNMNLRKSNLSQSSHWTKYAFMERRDSILFYYCAIPKKEIVPEGFIVKQIKAQRYLVVEHVGSMNQIYETYGKIYQQIFPNTQYITLQENFIHFEKYDYRFHWNKENSIIEIWIPIKS